MRIAAEHDIDLDQVEGTGRGGRVRKQDVLAFIEGNGAAKEEPPMHIESPYRPEPVAAAQAARGGAGARRPGEPLSRMRQSIGRAHAASRCRPRRRARRSSRPT